MVDTWQTCGRMEVMANPGSAMGLPLTSGQTVKIETSNMSTMGLVVDL